MSSEPISPFVLGQKPQAKLLSPACRNLFGRSDASVVTQMLNEIIVAERQKGCFKLSFDIHKERPIKQEQQENMTDIDRTPEQRRRYHWKEISDSEAPEFYSRRYKGKKSLMPVDLLQCDGNQPAGQNRRSRAVRRSLNGYLRSPSKHLSPKTAPILRPASAMKFQTSPLRLSSPFKQIDSPVSFDDSCRNRVNLSVLRPLPVHASSDNVTTTKITSPLKPVVINPVNTARSPVTPRKSNTFCVRALDFSDRIQRPVFSTDVLRNSIDNSVTVGQLTPSLVEEPLPTPTLSTPMTPAQSTTVPMMSAKSLKQLKITDMVAIRKPRSPVVKARKRLALSQEDSPVNVPTSKNARLA